MRSRECRGRHASANRAEPANVGLKEGPLAGRADVEGETVGLSGWQIDDGLAVSVVGAAIEVLLQSGRGLERL